MRNEKYFVQGTLGVIKATTPSLPHRVLHFGRNCAVAINYCIMYSIKSAGLRALGHLGLSQLQLHAAPSQVHAGRSITHA